MKPGDIVRTTCDLTPLADDHLPVGTRLRLIQSRPTSNGRRWMVDDKHGRRMYEIPEEALEVIA